MTTDKFITINYRHADNTRHAIQIEQFYIDALKAINIDATAFTAENAGHSQVTRNVKRAIVGELVKRATREVNIIQQAEAEIDLRTALTDLYKIPAKNRTRDAQRKITEACREIGFNSATLTNEQKQKVINYHTAKVAAHK